MLHIHLLSIGERMPAWVDQGYEDYIKRLPAHIKVNLSAIAALKRNKSSDLDKVLQTECQKLKQFIPKDAYVIALDRLGKVFSSREWAEFLLEWQENYKDVVFMIGGPEGIDQTCLQQAHQVWSLSSLTFPHSLVRLIFIEQIYRAYTIIQQHPYHR